MLKARALANVGRSAESEALALHLLVGATPDEEATLRRDLAMVKFQQGLVGETSIELVRAAELASDERRRTRLVAETSFAHLFVADFATARSVAAEASREGERVGDIGAIVAAEMVGGLVALYDHDLDEAVRLATRLEAFSDLPEAADATLYQPWFAASLIRITLGEYDHARKLNGIGRRRSQRAGYLWMVPAYDALDAYVALNLGELDDAEAIATSAIGWGIDDSFGATLWCHGFRALVAAARGDWDLVRTSITAAEALVLPAQAQFGWTHLALARTALAEHEGRPGEGYDALCETWDVYEAFGIESPRQELGPSMARLAHQAGDDERLGRIVDFMERSAERTGHRLWHAEAYEVAAWRRTDDTLMCRASEMYTEAGRHLHAAEVMSYAAELAVANERPTSRWYAAQAHEMLERLGATGLLVRLSALIDVGATEPAAARSASAADSLSRSERAVVALVAEGLTNTQIAEQLFLSRRTVESHVSAAYRKLNLSNRVELARVVLEA
jgi:DNA-binding CsgD family transcriptional regulator